MLWQYQIRSRGAWLTTPHTREAISRPEAPPPGLHPRYAWRWIVAPTGRTLATLTIPLPHSEE